MTRAQYWLTNILRWFDSSAGSDHIDSTSRSFNVVRVIPFIALHLACLLAFFTGVSGFALAFALGFFILRMFAILGASAAQRGPLWWAAHHRHHHQHSDQEEDLHSPHHGGFWWSHAGWFTCDAGFSMDERRVKDWLKFPELRFVNRFDSLVPAAAAVLIYILGDALAAWAPGLGTNGLQLLVWGFFISTVALFHATVSINSLSHVWGKRRFDTPDDSRNNFWLALLTLGEGWHNNHHRWPQSEYLNRNKFDQVIFACHSDQALAMLSDPTDEERSILGAIAYQRNDVVLHTDSSVLPSNRRAWAAWNYYMPEHRTEPVSVTYNMNILQNFHDAPETFCVTLNRSRDIAEERIIKRFDYAHPVFTLDAVAAQNRYEEIGNRNRSHFCGAYWFNGFHEDGVRSALRVTEALGVEL